MTEVLILKKVDSEMCQSFSQRPQSFLCDLCVFSVNSVGKNVSRHALFNPCLSVAKKNNAPPSEILFFLFILDMNPQIVYSRSLKIIVTEIQFSPKFSLHFRVFRIIDFKLR